MLDSYEASRLRPNQMNEERLRAYLDPKIKKQQLDIFQKMIQVTELLLDKQNVGINQTMQEPPIKDSKRNEIKERFKKTGKKPSATKETNLEFPTKDWQKEIRNKIPPQPFAKTQNKTVSLNKEVVPIMVPNTENSKESEQWVQNLWREIRETKLKEILEEKAPIKELDLDKSQLNIEVESRYADCGSEESGESEARSNKTLPSFIGEFDARSDIRRVPPNTNLHH